MTSETDTPRDRLLRLANTVIVLVGLPKGEDAPATPNAIPASTSEEMLRVLLEKAAPILDAQGRKELAAQVRQALSD